MTTLFNSANTNVSSSSSAFDHDANSKIHLTQKLKNALQSLVKDLDQNDSQDCDQFRERLTEIISLTDDVDQQEKFEQQQLGEILEQIRLAKDTETLLNQTVTKISQLLDLERVLVYKFDSEKTGTVVAEALQQGFTPAMGENIPPLCFGLVNANHYQQVKVAAISNVQQTELSPYQGQLLERFQVRASLAIPILLGGQVWG
ncbi:MAG: GAF domain-containing protein, partial [Xenococcaceae cyanobacterium MO_167.B52]|nr:GAF domain-containing protein [Xenococcaceae cyanobacterium MO_167.B52]